MKQQLVENKNCKAPKCWSQAAEIMIRKMFENHPQKSFLKLSDNLRIDYYSQSGKFLFCRRNTMSSTSNDAEAFYINNIKSQHVKNF